MAILKANPTGKCASLYEVTTLASGATAYTSAFEINPLPKAGQEKKYVTVYFDPSAAPATGNYDIDLYGSATSGGTKVKLADDIIADTSSADPVAASLEISKYPMPYYYIGVTSAGNDGAKTARIALFGEVE